MGYLLLEGGAEFGGKMREPDLRAMELAGGFDAPVCIIPTAAAPDNNHQRAGNNGKRWFEGLGTRHVSICMIVDKASANDEGLCASIRNSKLVYLLGGFPRHLGETLLGSKAFAAMQEVHQHGGVLAGSSAGAMVLCEHFYDPYEKKLCQGLGLVKNTCVLPHYDTFGRSWVKTLQAMNPNMGLLGIDERTGMVNDGPGGEWSVSGSGEVTLIRPNQPEVRTRGGVLSYNP
jgi:cyanophycinase